MNTKPKQLPVPTPFPTCGEVFEFLVNSLDFPAWFDLLAPSGITDKGRAGRISDQLRAWALEPDGRVPSRDDFDSFVLRNSPELERCQGGSSDDTDKLRHILTWLLNRALDEHRTVIREITTHLGRDETRAWYGRGKAPDAIYSIFILRKLLLRLPDMGGPMLEPTLEKILRLLWADSAPAHPLLKECFAYYRPTHVSATEADIRAWMAGETRPHFHSLASYFREHERLEEIMVNFGVALLIEELSHAFSGCVSPDETRHATSLLQSQAACLSRLEEQLAADLPQSSWFSLEDYTRYLDKRVAEFRADIVNIVNQGDANLLDLRFAELRCHRDFFEGYSRAVIPQDFKSFSEELGAVWNSTQLSAHPSLVMQAQAQLAVLRQRSPTWAAHLSGVCLAIDARLTLAKDARPTQDTLLKSFGLYREAISQCRYRVGFFTPHIIQEALGLAALIQRGKVSDGARLLDWIKNTLDWWNLVGFGKDFDHEQAPQRVEKAERKFIDELHVDLRKRLREGLSLQSLDHAYIGGMFGMVEPAAMERLKEPVDKRQKRPLVSAATGRDQSPLMEMIDRRELTKAFDLVRAGADLNFINSTGDTCVTKAFACEAYDLVLEILRREENPITRKTLIRETDKNRHNALEMALSHGRVDVLRELVKWKPNRGGEIDLNQDRVMGGLTALYHAVMLAAVHRMTPEQFVDYMWRTQPVSDATRFAQQFLKNHPRGATFMKLLKEEMAKGGYSKELGLGHPERAGEIISYLLTLVPDGLVEIDATCTRGHSAFTLAVENHLHDIALQLLVAGANVNHRCDDGATALCFAIRDDDFEMAKLLHEHRADDRLFVAAMGRPIHAMDMSERMRTLYPRRV